MTVEANRSGDNAVYDVIITGGGPAGLSAAMYAARAKLKTLVIDKNPAAGALGMAHKIENYPGIPEGMPGPELLEQFKQHALQFGAEISQEQVYGADLSGETKLVFTATDTYEAKTVIITTGSMGRTPSIEGEEEFTGRGVSYCATCDAAFYEGKDVALVGNIEEIMEEIDSVATFVNRIYVITYNRNIKEDQQQSLEDDPRIELIPGSRVKKIEGTRGVEKITVQTTDNETREIPVTGVFLYLHGNKPIIDFLYGTLETSPDGCLSVNHDDMSTSVQGVYAAGDVTCRKVRQVVIAAAEGSIAALSAERFIHKREGVKSQWAASAT